MIITQTLCNKYTKTQSYMQCCTMSVKNLVGRLEVHDKMDHTPEVRSLSLGKIIGKPVNVTLFCENVSTMYDRHKLKRALKHGVFTPRPRLRRVCQVLSLLSQVQPRKYLTRRLYLWTIQNTQLLNCSQNNFISSRLKVIKLVGFP